MVGLGMIEYARDSFNLFDAAIVLMSVIEITLEASNIGFSAGGAFTAFRGIRLLRVFKLARSWTSFREMLAKIIVTINDVSSFVVLLLICMSIFTLLGMELFAHKVKLNSLQEIVINDEGHEHLMFPPRPNFDTVYNGFIAIFIVFVGEDWSSVMYTHYRSQGSIAQIFFPILFVCLNLMLMNLFLVNVLINFSVD